MCNFLSTLPNKLLNFVPATNSEASTGLPTASLRQPISKALYDKGGGVLKKVLWCLLALVFLAVGTLWYETSNYMFPWRVNESIKYTLLWGGLADLPDNVTDFDIEMSGSAFTRTFDMQFTSSNEELKSWVNKSKRLKNNTPIVLSEFISKYEIYPGEEKAVGGWVQIDWQKHEVKIHIVWS